MDNHLKSAEIFATLLDNRFSLFGYKFGVNVILDLIPGGGDLAAFFLSFYLIWLGMRMGLPASKLFHMFWNIFINFVFGLIPFLGDIIYLFRKANLKNYKILKDFAGRNVTAEKSI